MVLPTQVKHDPYGSTQDHQVMHVTKSAQQSSHTATKRWASTMARSTIPSLASMGETASLSSTTRICVSMTTLSVTPFLPYDRTSICSSTATAVNNITSSLAECVNIPNKCRVSKSSVCDSWSLQPQREKQREKN